MERYNLPKDVITLESSRGRMRIWWAAPNVMIQSTHGYTDAVVAKKVVDALGRSIPRAATFRMFHDAWEHEGYDTEFRVGMANWAKASSAATTGRLLSVDVLVRSKLVAMGVAVANLVAGGIIRSHSRLETYSAALIQAGGGEALRREASAVAH
jgi:hypothetical protein